MNYILVKKSDVGELFPHAKQVGDELLLTMNHIKVLAGKSVRIITHAEAMSLVGSDKTDEEASSTKTNNQ